MTEIATTPETGARPRFGSSGGEIAFSDIGSGPAVLLLHGFPFWSVQWRHFIPALAARSRVIVPDLLGAGESAMSEDRPLGIAAQARYVQELLDHLGIEQLAVVGHGTGGGVAQLLALENSAVEAVVLLSSVTLASPCPPDAVAELAHADSPASVRAVFEAILDAGARQRDRITDELIDTYAGPYRDHAAMLERGATSDDAAELGAREEELERIRVPTLILWGEEDPFAPIADADRLNDAIASSTLGLLPGCGHLLPDEAPATLAPMVAEYLRAMYLRAPHGHPDDAKRGVVMLQLERRPPWVDLAEDEADDWFVDDDEEERGP